MSQVLSYTTKRRDRRIVEVPFELDGEQFTARRPKDSVLVYLQAARANAATTADRLHATMMFLDGCLTPAAQSRIQSRLRDYDDDLELDDLVELMHDLGQKFAAEEAENQGAAKPTRVGAAGRVITPDGRDAQVIEPAADKPNRAARRAKAAPTTVVTAKTAAKAVTAKKAAKAVAKKTGRSLPR